MRVLLINPEAKFNARSVGIPLGIIAIASYLEKKGHTVKIVDRSLRRINVVKIAKEFSPDIIGVSVIGSKSAPDSEKNIT